MYTEADIVADTVARLAARGIISRRESARAIEAVGITRDEFTAAFRVHAEHNRVALPSRATLTVGKPAEDTSKAGPRSLDDCQTSTYRLSSSEWTASHPSAPTLIGSGKTQGAALGNLADLLIAELAQARTTVEVTEADDTDAAHPLPTAEVPSDDEGRERGDDAGASRVGPDPAPAPAPVADEPVDEAPRPEPRRRTGRAKAPAPTPAEAAAYNERYPGHARPFTVVGGKVHYRCACGEECGPNGDGWHPAEKFGLRSDRVTGRRLSRSDECRSRYQRQRRVTTQMFSALNAVGIEFDYDPSGLPTGLTCAGCGETFKAGDHVSLMNPTELAHIGCAN